MTLTQTIVDARLADRPHRFYESIPSTMDDARDWLLQGAPHGALVAAARQTAGRGRMGRKWQDAGESALALSVIFKLPSVALPQVPMLGGIIVYDTLRALGVTDVSVKWPNDVLIGTRKVSGVLVETAWDGVYLSGAIMGVGINLSGSFGSADLAESAISVAEALGAAPDTARLFSLLIDQLDLRMPGLNSPEIYEAWRSRLGTIGRRVRIESSSPFEGIAEDANEIGALLVRADDGQLRTVLAGDVRLRPA